MKIPASVLAVMLVGLGSVGVMGCAAHQTPTEKAPKNKPDSVEPAANPQPETPNRPSRSAGYECRACGMG